MQLCKKKYLNFIFRRAGFLDIDEIREKKVFSFHLTIDLNFKIGITSLILKIFP